MVAKARSSRATGLRLRPRTQREWHAAGGLPGRLPSAPAAGGEGWRRGTARGEPGARRGAVGGWARVKSGFIFPILSILDTAIIHIPGFRQVQVVQEKLVLQL